jgi:hypothetical protein
VRRTLVFDGATDRREKGASWEKSRAVAVETVARAS